MASLLRVGCDLIETLCNEGQLDRAIDFLFRMDTAPSTNTYLSLLKACNKSKVLTQAKQVQTHLVKHVFQPTGYLGDYLVMTLAKCGAIEDALQISRRLPRRTVYSWTALISAYTECGQGQEALKLHRCMQQDGVEPNHYTFVSLLKACGSIPDLEEGRKLHADARRMGFGVDVYLCTTLVSMYGKCGAIKEAENVFSVLSQRDVVAWNAMLAAYVDQGLADKALQLYRQMHDEGVCLDQLMFVISLQACGTLAEKEEGGSTKVMSLEIGRALHADARRVGFVSGVFMFTTLVNMYSKCGTIGDAENVFTTALSQRNNVTWNVMISAYFEHDQERKALQLYKHMQEEGTITDQYTFAIALQACGALAEKEEALIVDGQLIKVMSLEMGKALHADAWRMNLASDIFVSNTLVRIYGKCGAIVEAEDVFCKLSNRDIVSCNALLSAYLEHGQGEKSLHLYKQMQEESLSPDQLTFVMALQACGKLAEKEEGIVVEGWPTKVMSLEIGRELHADARRKGFASDVAVGDALVRMYSRCGTILHAEDVFGALCGQHDVRSWTAMLSAYAEQGHSEKALQLYSQMQKEGFSPDQHTFVMALYSCGTLAEKEESVIVDGQPTKVMSLEIGKAIHADSQRKGFASDIFVNNTLVSMYGKCGTIAQAEDVFSAMSHHDEVSWNAMLSAYDEQGEKVLHLYRQMQEESLSPNQLTFVIALQACSTLSEMKEATDVEGIKAVSFEIGQAIHSDAKRKGFASDVVISNTLVSMYGKCGTIQDAEDMFGAMCQRDTVSWTAMLSTYVEQGQGEKALQLYRQMQKQGAVLDEVTLVCMLQSCSEMVSLEICREHHFTIVSAGYDLKLSLAVTLIHTYGSCASIIDAQAAFDELHQPHIASWNACIASYAGEGDCKASLYMFEKLQLVGIEPDEVTFIGVLRACSHAGLAVKGFECFEYMSRVHGLYPDLKHYGIMVDLLGRAGDFKRVEDVLGRMPKQADLTMWLCLLGACRIHGNVEVGEHAFNLAQSLQPRQTAAYVLMSNIYVEAGLQDYGRKLENSLVGTVVGCTEVLEAGAACNVEDEE